MRWFLGVLVFMLVAPSVAPGATVEVQTRDNFWTPADPDTTLGDTVRWTFDQADSDHTLTVIAPGGGAPVIDQVTVAGRPPINYTPPATGRYSVLCQIHSPMRARFDVEAETEPQAPVAGATLSPPVAPGQSHGGPVQLSLAATDDSAVESIAYRINGGTTSTYTAPVRFSTEGARTVDYRATDIAGNQDTWRSVAFTIDDATAPVTAVGTSSSGSSSESGGVTTYSSSVDVSLSASDTGGLGVDRSEISVDGEALKPYDDAVTIRGAGAHTVSYRSIDRAGNVEETRRLDFAIAGGQAPREPSFESDPLKLKASKLIGGVRFAVGCSRTGEGLSKLTVEGKAARKLGLKRGNALAEGTVEPCENEKAAVRLSSPRALRRELKGLRGKLDAKLQLKAVSAEARIPAVVSP